VAPARMSEIVTKQGLLQADELQLPYLETGTGAPLIVFPAKPYEPFDELLRQFAQSRRVISLDSARTTGEANGLGGKISQALATLGVNCFTVLGVSAGAGPALALAAAAPASVDRLVLLSPLLFGENAELTLLPQIKPATLVLVGTGDRPEAIDAARHCRERIRSCHLSFVYGAGHGIAADRLDVCHNLIMEFLERGEQFIIFRESQLLRQ
jgi:pimeloyl-ACP methyl ester carboxylesterase